LEELALGSENAHLLHGWRYEIFGRDAELLITGKLKLSLNPISKQVVFEEI